MKDYNEVYDLIRKQHTTKAKPRLVAEFNHNRYSIPTAINTPAATEDSENPDLFPIKSIAIGRRPGRGINKARVDEAYVSEDYEVNPKSVRYYTAQADDTYKYWTSPQMSAPNTPVEQARNLALNPSFEKAAASTQIERFRNMVTNPLPTSALGYNTVNGSSIAYDNTRKGLRVQIPSGGTSDSGILFSGTAQTVEPGMYTYSIEIEAIVSGTFKLSIQGGVGTNTGMAAVAIAAGETRRISTMCLHTATGTPAPYVLRGSAIQSDFVVRKVMKTKTNFEVPYFDGSMSNNSIFSPLGLDYSYNWAGTANASQTICMGPTPTQTVFTNFATNPSFETGHGGWDKAGNGITGISVTTSQQWAGTSSLQVVCDGTFGSQGTYTTTKSVVTPSQTYTASVWVKGEAGKMIQIELGEWTSGGATVGTRTMGTSTAATGQWQRLSVSRAFGSTGTQADIVVRNIAAVAHTFYVDAVMLTATSVLLDYFDGSYATGKWADPDFTPTWSGTAGSSTSTVRAVTMQYVSTTGSPIQSFKNMVNGRKSVRVLTTSPSRDSYADVLAMIGGFSGMVDGKTYTILARSYQDSPLTNPIGGNKPRAIWAVTTGGANGDLGSSTPGPNIAGYTDHRFTFTVNTGATYKSIRMVNGSDVNGGDIWWDNFMMVEGNYTGPYLDGDITSSGDDVYEWAGTPHASQSTYSKLKTAFSGTTETYPTDVNPQVTYAAPVKTNKIVIGLENSYSSPEEYAIYTQSEVGGTWTKIKDAPTDSLTFDDEGRLILYWNGTTWDQEKSISQYTTLTGVQLRVETMTEPESYFNLIELALKLEWDMTSYLMSVSDTFDMGDTSTLNPLGHASSNVADVEFFNHYENNNHVFSSENTDGLFYGLMEENVKFTLDYIYETAIGSPPAVIRQFQMYSTNHWSAGSLKSVSISLRDSSKFLQETKGQACYFENRTVASLVFLLCDSIGFDQYDIGKLGKQKINGEWEDIDIATNNATVPHFWAGAEATIWETLASLAEGTQTAIYFNAFDRLQVRTRDQAFSEIPGDVWTFRGKTSADELTDIRDYNIQASDVSNDVTINYQTTAFEEFVSGARRNTVIWQPEDEVVYVKASTIQKDISTTDMEIRFTPGDAALWPFEGMMQIGAEYFKYKGKKYTYYPSTSNNPVDVNASGTVVWLESFDDYKKYHYDSTPVGNRHLNKFSGDLKVTQRGEWNTPVLNHIVDTNANWEQKNFINNQSYADASAFWKNPGTLASYKAAADSEAHNAQVAIQQAAAAQQADYNAQLKAYKKAIKKIKPGHLIPAFTYRPSANFITTHYDGSTAANDAYQSWAALYNKYKNAAVTDGIDVPAEKGTLRFATNSDYSWGHYLAAIQGSTDSTGYKYYSTRIRFNGNTGFTSQIGGMLFQSNNGSTEDAYYYEIQQGGMSYGNTGPGSVALFRKDAAGNVTHLFSHEQPILADKWYTLNVTVEGDAGTAGYNLQLFVEGIQVGAVYISGSNKLGHTGRCGMYVRGVTDANFEFFSAVPGKTSSPLQAAVAPPSPNWDRLRGRFKSNWFIDEYVNNLTGIFSKFITPLAKVPSKYSGIIYDEFGPVAHEIRNFKVSYDTNEMPVIAPYPYYSNTGNINILRSSVDSYGADIYMINTAHEDAALKATDDLHTFMVYGLVLKQKDMSTVNKKNENSIAAVGSKQLTFESKWIQNEASANALGEWIVKHWTLATDVIELTSFGNPLIEVGDVVSLDIPSANISEQTHKYFVTGVSTGFSDGGMVSTFTLRRARN